MAKLPGLFKRGDIYYLRTVVPNDLRAVYGGRTRLVESLGVTSSAAAKTVGAAQRAIRLREFDERRKELNPRRIERITPELADLLAQRVAASVLRADETLRTQPALLAALMEPARDALARKLTIAGTPPAPAEIPDDPLGGLPDQVGRQFAELNQQLDANASMHMALQRVAAILPLAQAEARKLGIAFDAQTPGALDALRACLKAYRKARHQVVLRDQGEVVETPELPRHGSAQSQPKTLRDVLGRFVAVKDRKPETNRKYELAIEDFEAFKGRVPLQQITRAMGDEFRAWLRSKEDLSSKTAHDRFTMVKTLLLYAARDLELIPRNPWEGLDIPYQTEEEREPWTEEELKALFGLPLFTLYELPSNAKAGGAAAYWVPLLGLYSGARISELCQLRVSDVEVGRYGPFISFNDKGAKATIKTKASIRRLPVHSDLIRLGFLEHLEAVKRAGSESLWPALRLRDARPGGYFSGWFSEFHRKAAGTDDIPPFHSFRHNVRTALEEAGANLITTRRLIGHATGLSKVEEGYTHISDRHLRETIELLRYPFLHFPKVYRPDA